MWKLRRFRAADRILLNAMVQHVPQILPLSIIFQLITFNGFDCLVRNSVIFFVAGESYTTFMCDYYFHFVKFLKLCTCFHMDSHFCHWKY